MKRTLMRSGVSMLNAIASRVSQAKNEAVRFLSATKWLHALILDVSEEFREEGMSEMVILKATTVMSEKFWEAYFDHSESGYWWLLKEAPEWTSSYTQ
jgi:hypothetical protein